MKKLNFISRIKLIGAITLLAWLFFLAGTANATPILYDNLGATSNGVDPVAGWTDGWNGIFAAAFRLFLRRDPWDRKAPRSWMFNCCSKRMPVFGLFFGCSL